MIEKLPLKGKTFGHANPLEIIITLFIGFFKSYLDCVLLEINFSVGFFLSLGFDSDPRETLH
jgi:hypothetical protein